MLMPCVGCKYIWAPSKHSGYISNTLHTVIYKPLYRRKKISSKREDELVLDKSYVVVVVYIYIHILQASLQHPGYRTENYRTQKVFFSLYQAMLVQHQHWHSGFNLTRWNFVIPPWPKQLTDHDVRQARRFPLPHIHTNDFCADNKTNTYTRDKQAYKM